MTLAAFGAQNLAFEPRLLGSANQSLAVAAPSARKHFAAGGDKGPYDAELNALQERPLAETRSIPP
jgi:hypothetical protein